MTTVAESLVVPSERERAKRGYYLVHRTFDGRLFVRDWRRHDDSTLNFAYHPLDFTKRRIERLLRKLGLNVWSESKVIETWTSASDIRLRAFLLNRILFNL